MVPQSSPVPPMTTAVLPERSKRSLRKDAVCMGSILERNQEAAKCGIVPINCGIWITRGREYRPVDPRTWFPEDSALQ